MSVYFLLLFAPRLGLLCPMGISGDYEETNGRPALSRQHTQPAKFLLIYILQFGQIQTAIWTNTNCNLDKYKIIFGKIQLAIW